MIADPENEFDPTLSQALEHAKGEGQFQVFLGQLRHENRLALGTPRQLRLILDVLVFFKLPLEEQTEIVRQTDHQGLHKLGRRTARPSLVLLKAVLRLIERLFNIPAPLVEEGQQTRRKLEVRG